MALTDEDLRALGHHLARHLPSYGDRARIARDAGLDDSRLSGSPATAWAALLVSAHERGELALVLRLASRHRPEQPDLAEWARAATEGHLVVPPAGPRAERFRDIAVAGGLVVLLGLGAAVGDLARGDASAPIAAPSSARPAPSASAMPETSPDLGVDAPAPPRDEAAERPGAASEPEPEPEPEPRAQPPATDAAASPPDTAETAPASPTPVGRCPGEPGQVVGYAYAGRSSPGRRGEIWLLRQNLYVRADYPRAENGWSARARAICDLPAGTRVELRRAPIAVDGGAWWVPIVAGTTTP